MRPPDDNPNGRKTATEKFSVATDLVYCRPQHTDYSETELGGSSPEKGGGKWMSGDWWADLRYRGGKREMTQQETDLL